MKDLNYFPLDVESNIYGMTTLEFQDRTTKVLVATRNCQIYCINYSKFKPQTREVEFTYIPNGAKIISIGALKRGTDDFVIGIIHSLGPSVQKNPASTVNDYNKSTTYYFNIYASGCISQKFDLDYVAQGCQTIRLRYVPYHLYQTELFSIQGDSSANNQQIIVRKRPFWLLSGGDKAIHAFSEDRPYQSFNEVPIEDCLPELTNIQGLALWIDVLNIQDTQTGFQRAIALGFEDGTVRLYHSVMSTKTMNKYETVRVSSFDDYNTIVPCVRLFKVRSTTRSILRDKLERTGILKNKQATQTIQPEKLNLLVVSSTNSSLVFQDVLQNGLDNKLELPESQRLDCATSATVGDTNVDGYNELLIGTHGKELLTYQYNLDGDCFELSQVSILNYPVFTLTILDLTGDGLNDVIILLENGVLLMQAVVKDVVASLKSRMNKLLSLLE